MTANDADIDKFSTLFSPGTPRASPTQSTVPLPANDELASKVKHSSHTRRNTSVGSADDFGAFVSVSASEDPLAYFDPMDGDDFVAPGVIASSTGSTSISRTSASLSFFDKVARDAKLASDRNKKGVLDELLLHEDDPLYWLKDPVPSSQPQEEPIAKDDTELFGEMVEGTEAALIDLSFDENSLPPAIPVTTGSPPQSPSDSPTRRHPTRLANASFPQVINRKRSSSLAPPIASTSSVSSTPTPSVADAEGRSPSRPIPTRSPSYQTLSSLSSKWMTSFMSSARQPAPTNTLESLFAPLTSSRSSSSSVSHTRQSSVSPSRHPQPPLPNNRSIHNQQHHHIPSLPISSSLPDVQISHGTPFARPAHSSNSPFAPHVYVPPTGAPGYGGERYDWDKGFSEELQHELTLADEANIPKKSVSVLIEKKSGGVDLTGRWDTTTEILTPNLADLIRPHLPALSRLSRKWTLLYSLDQHGISLNTLYDRCERLGQVKSAGGITHSRGALVVMKDTGDAIFGAWVGEGIRMSKGRGYYGSGESFLWRFVGERLQVFKWTGKNEYVSLSEPDYISFGGGEGHYGLYLDDTLFEGSSARCPTFDNDPLCSPGPKKAGSVSFECVGLEVWGVNS